MNKNSSKNKIDMIDLFAGAGGLTLGFYQNNFNPKITIEFDKCAIETYNFNFKKNEKPIDITTDEVNLELKKAKKLNNHILIGGFPCQGFSLAGKRNPDDPRNKLYKGVLKFVNETKPRVFVLENVTGIISMNSGSDLKTILSDFEESGWYLRYTIIDSSHFGVAQKRKRVIFVGADPSLKDKVDISIENIEKLKNEKRFKEKNVKDAIEDLMNINEDKEWNHIFTNHTDKIKNKIINLNEGESLYKNYSDGWRKIYWLKPSPTVKENHGGVHLHPILNRALTPRELARLQSFPDDFIFKGTKSQQLKQIGNAVPVQTANIIAKIIRESFYGE